MKKHHFLLFTALFLLAACKNQKQENPGTAVAKKNYFPVADFLRSEIHYVDSLPLGITKYQVQHNHSDTAYIKTEEFDQLAAVFLPPVLSSAAFENDYTEVSFMDQTTQTVTFTYSTQNSKQDLQRIDVLAKPEEGVNQVKSIYMEKVFNKNDAHVIQKMYWKARRSFLVITSVQPAGQPPVISQLKVVWDGRD